MVLASTIQWGATCCAANNPPLLALLCAIAFTLVALFFLGEGGLRLLYLWCGKQPKNQSVPQNSPRLVLVIPAHNEAGVIQATVQAACVTLGTSDELFVIADNCADDTAALAEQAGAKVLARQSATSSKGATLCWFLALGALQAEDVVVILDADTSLHPGFCAALRAAFAAPEVVAAQAFVQPVGVESSPEAALAAYSELLSQIFDEAARSRFEWPLRLRGIGMAFRANVLNELAPRLQTKIEDAELSLFLALKRQKMVFVPNAILDDPKPQDPALVATQRARWLQGERELWQLYRREIAALLRQGPRGWALFQATLLKPKTLFLAAKIGLWGVALALSFLWPVMTTSLILLTLSLIPDALYYLLGLRVVPNRAFYARTLLCAPLFLLMWGHSLALSFISKDRWLRARAGERRD